MTLDGHLRATPPSTTVALFEHAPELLSGVDRPRALELLRMRVPAMTLEPGPWSTLQGPREASRLLALFVVEGILLRRVSVGGRTGAELVGTGDVIQPWVRQPPLETLRAAAHWEVLERAAVAVLEADFLQRTSPAVAAALMARATERSHLLAFLHVASHTPGLEERLTALLWSLADRWGRVTREGVLVPLQLTHSTLAELVGASRPSVSTMLKRMETQGLLTRRPPGWLLLEPVAVAA